MIILTYGQPKSASTFLSLLVRRACEILGSDQDEIRSRVFSDDPSRTNAFWRGDLNKLAQYIDLFRDNDHLAVKTHAPFPKALEVQLKSGVVVPFISYRHIGDSALSAFEAGEKARAKKDFNQDFYKIETHRSAIDYIGGHVMSVTVPWIKSGAGFTFSYDIISSNPDVIIERLSSVTGVPVDDLLSDVEVRQLISGKKKAYNFNKGVPGRHREVFSKEDLRYLERNYGSFNRFCEGEISLEDL